MSVFHAVRLSRASITALLAVGMLWGSFAAFVPDIKARVGASDAEFGVALLMSAIGGMVSMYAAPRVTRLLGRPTLPILALLVVAAFFYPMLASTVAGLGFALFGMGISVALLDICANMRISQLEARHRLHLMNLNHAMFSFGFGGSAIVVSFARRAGLGATEVLPVLSLVCLGLAAVMIERRGLVTEPEEEVTGDYHSPWGIILPVAAILFAGLICENAAEAWSALHIERTLGGAPGEGSFGPAMLGLTMGAARLSGQFAATRLGEARLILWSAVVGIFGALVLAVAPSQALALLGVGLLGLGVAVVFPSANSILGRLVRPDLRNTAISRAWIIGFTGFFLGPSMMGLIAEYAGLRVAFGVIALVMATIIPCVQLLRRRGG